MVTQRVLSIVFGFIRRAQAIKVLWSQQQMWEGDVLLRIPQTLSGPIISAQRLSPTPASPVRHEAEYKFNFLQDMNKQHLCLDSDIVVIRLIRNLVNTRKHILYLICVYSSE